MTGEAQGQSWMFGGDDLEDMRAKRAAELRAAREQAAREALRRRDPNAANAGSAARPTMAYEPGTGFTDKQSINAHLEQNLLGAAPFPPPAPLPPPPSAPPPLSSTPTMPLSSPLAPPPSVDPYNNPGGPLSIEVPPPMGQRSSTPPPGAPISSSPASSSPMSYAPPGAPPPLRAGTTQMPGFNRPGGDGDNEELEALDPAEAAALLSNRPKFRRSLTMQELQAQSKSVREILESRSENVTLKQLAKRGVKNAKILDMSAVQNIVTEAVEKVLKRRGKTVSAKEKKEIEKEARKEFFELLEEHKKVVTEKTSLLEEQKKLVEQKSELLAKHKIMEGQKASAEKARDALQSQVTNLRQEIERQHLNLAKENQRHAVGQEIRFTANSFSEMEDMIRATFKSLVDGERRAAIAQYGAQAIPGMTALEERISEMLDRLLSDERERLLAKDAAEHEKRVEILEARIKKLNSALANTEEALRKVAKMKSIDPGIASVFRDIQGLNLEDLNFEKKTELLKVVFLENLELQGKEVTEDDRSDAPAPRGGTQALDLPDDFTPPVETLTSETAF